MKFYNLVTCSEFEWDEDVMVVSYKNGLKPQVSMKIVTVMLNTLLYELLAK